MSKLIRIENGAVSVSVNDLKILLDLYGVEDEATVSQLLDLARLSRQQRNWATEYREYISSAYIDFMGYESDAQRIKQFHPVIIPGLLQTEAYARALITAMAVRERTPEEIEARVRMRMERQARVVRRASSVHLAVAIDEPALRRSIGGKGVMREQVSHLQAMSDHPWIQVVVIPATVEAHPGLTGPFSLLEFDSGDDPDVVYLENAPNDVALVENPADILGYKKIFDKLLDIGGSGPGIKSYLSQLRAELG